MKTTKSVSNEQEKRVAKLVDGRVVVGSGATQFQKGDVVTKNCFYECKTSMSPKDSYKINKKDLQKADEQRFSMGKENYAFVFDFGDKQDLFVVLKMNTYLNLINNKENMND